MSVREVEDLIEQIDALPYGSEERQLIRQAIAKAIELDNPDLEYRLRMRQTSSAFMAGETETMLNSFTWCVSKHDSDPARFPYKVDAEDLLWQFKWMARMLLINPRFSLAQTAATVADMQRRYEEAGVGLSGVWQARFANALETGNIEDAARYREEREATPRDDYSHCDACVRSQDIDWFAEIGDEPRALEVFDEIIEGNLSCGEEPERAQGQALLPLLRAGRIDEAVYHHRRGLRFAERLAEPFPIVLPHLVFLAVTGNLARAVDVMETYLPIWGEDAIDLASRFRAARTFGVVADALVQAGHGDIPIRGTADPALAPLLGTTGELLDAASFGAACWRLAEDLAAAFDERNGNDHFAQRVRSSKALASERYDVPLVGPLQPNIEIPPVREDAASLLASAKMNALGGNSHAALTALERALPLADPQQRLDALFELARVKTVADANDADEAVAAYAEALRAAGRLEEALFYETAGYRALAQEEIPPMGFDQNSDLRVRLLWLWHKLDRFLIDGELEQAQDAFAELRSQCPPELTHVLEGAQVTMLHTLADAESDEMVPLAEQLAASDHAWLAYPGNVQLARYFGRQGRFAEGLAPVERAFALAIANGCRPLATHAAALSASLLWDDGQYSEAINRQRVAVRQSQLDNEPSEIGLRFQLARWLSELGASFEAADEYDAVARLEEASGVPAESIASTYLYLGHAIGADDPGRAYSALRRGYELAQETSDPGVIIPAAVSLGQFLFTHDDDECVQIFESVLPLLEHKPDAKAVVWHWLGRARCQYGDPAGLADLERALDLERAVENAWAVADITDSTGRALIALERVPEGVAHLLTAADLYAGADDLRMAVMSEVMAARTLQSQGSTEEAVACYDSARHRALDSADLWFGISEELASFLEESGDHARAQLVRDEMARREQV